METDGVFYTAGFIAHQLPDGRQGPELVNKDHPSATEVHGEPDEVVEIAGRRFWPVMDRHGQDLRKD